MKKTLFILSLGIFIFLATAPYALADSFMDGCTQFEPHIAKQANVVIQNTAGTVLFNDTMFIKRVDGGATGYFILPVVPSQSFNFVWLSKYDTADQVTYYSTTETVDSTNWVRINVDKSYEYKTTTAGNYKRVTDVISTISPNATFIKVVLAGSATDFNSPKISEINALQDGILDYDAQDFAKVPDTSALLENVTVADISDTSLIGRTSASTTITEYLRFNVTPGDVVEFTYYKKSSGYDFDAVIGLVKKGSKPDAPNNVNIDKASIDTETTHMGSWDKVVCVIPRSLIDNDTYKIVFKFPTDGATNKSNIYFGNMRCLSKPLIKSISYKGNLLENYSMFNNEYNITLSLDVGQISAGDITALPFSKSDIVSINLKDATPAYERQVEVVVQNSADATSQTTYVINFKSEGFMFVNLAFDNDINPFEIGGNVVAKVNLLSFQPVQPFILIAGVYDQNDNMVACGFTKVEGFIGTKTADMNLTIPVMNGGKIRVFAWNAINKVNAVILDELLYQ